MRHPENGPPRASGSNSEPSAPDVRRGRRRAVGFTVLLAAALLFVGAPSAAEPGWSWSPYRVTLEDASGATLRTFTKDGTTFVLGYFGERFAVRIENPSDLRVEAVLSIDGRDAVSGRPGDYAHQRGYLIPAHGAVLVDGFRTSLDDVAAFRFTRPGDSYSARMGTPQNVGVVGVAFFPESRPIRPPVRRAPYEERRSWDDYRDAPSSKSAAEGSPRPSAPRKAGSGAAPVAPGDDSASARGRAASRTEAERAPSRLGTEYGESRFSPVTEVPFRRSSPTAPASLIRLRYDDAGGLRARGIEVYPRRQPRPRPQEWDDYSEEFWPEPGPEAFPANRFAPPPP